MHVELRKFRLHFFPETIKEFQDIHLWVEVNMPCQAFIHRPVPQLQELKLLLLTDENTINDKCND
jgi:hypothetical protein